MEFVFSRAAAKAPRHNLSLEQSPRIECDAAVWGFIQVLAAGAADWAIVALLSSGVKPPIFRSLPENQHPVRLSLHDRYAFGIQRNVYNQP